MTDTIAPPVAAARLVDGTATPRGGTPPDATGALDGPALGRRLAATAQALHGLGIRAGDRVLVQGDNSIDYVVTLLALMRLDTSLVPLDHRLSAGDAAAAARQARVRWLVTAADPTTGFPGVPDHRIVHYPHLTPVPSSASTSSPAPLAAGADPLDAWFRRSDALVLWSSGTTGRPKGIVKPGHAVLDNSLRTIRAMGYRADDVLAPLLPFSHQYGLSVILLWWLARCTLLVTPYQRLDAAVGQAAAHGATAVDAAPSTYHSLLGVVRRRPEVRAGLAGVRVWGVGGAPLPAPLAESFRTTMGRPLLDGYGLTELGNVALATPDSPHGCGRPLPGVRLRVVRPDGTVAAPGELGGIEVRSPGLMAGYLREDGSLGPVDQDAWYPTADLGSVDADGTVRVVGRNQAVHRLGFTLYPESLERRAEACGRPVKVLAVEDQRRGSALHFVVADPEGDAPLTWRRRLAEHLAEYEQPNVVHVVDHFPLTANGKPDARALRAQLGLGS
ncbi:AMP-binding protein [Streptomyces nigrescens]|uniref:AMP-binding protein n=1 Tax=Streptomyces nigrescens TaxID=1920 RepID=A0ABM8A4Q2_STRNI|nr:class I adenylate-forming enzyme family protein [Streptomyces nigrescens]BDM73610.1 AMP-binding protein [Streptomyces nigrescens]